MLSREDEAVRLLDAWDAARPLQEPAGPIVELDEDVAALCPNQLRLVGLRRTLDHLHIQTITKQGTNLCSSRLLSYDVLRSCLPPPPRSFIRNKHVILLVITYHAVISSTYVDHVLQTRDPCSPVTLLQETEAQVTRKLRVPSDEEVHLHFLVQPSQHSPAEILHHAVVLILPTAKHNCN